MSSPRPDVPWSALPQVSFGRVCLCGVVSLLAGGLISIPVFFLAIVVSFSSAGSATVVELVGFASAITFAGWWTGRALRKSIILPARIVVAAATTLGLAVVAVGWAVVTVVGVIVEPGFLVLVAAEVGAVVVWGAAVHRLVNGGR